MNEIKFIYFDIGGVLLLDFSGTNKWAEMKKDLGVNGETAKKLDLFWRENKQRFSSGIDLDATLPEFSQKLGIVFPKGYSMLADFIKRFDLNPSIWPLAKAAKEKYKVGLLTNMYPKMLNLIQKKRLIPDINWDVIADSSVVRSKKPDQKIYEVAEQKTGVKPQEILFVDNLLENVEAAKNRGWQTFLYDAGNPEKSSKELVKILKLEL